MTRPLVLLTTALLSLTLACDGAAKADNGTAKPKTDAKAQKSAEPAKAAPETSVAARVEPATPEPAAAKPATPPSAATAPVSPEAAARELAAFLAQPTKAPAPAIVGPTSEIEVREFCGACDGPEKNKPKTSKVSGRDALAKRATALAEAAVAGVLSTEERITCKQDCCKFVPDPELGIGDNVANLEQVCFTLDASGKATAITRIDVSGTW